MPAILKPIPDGYHSVTPYLIVDNVAGLVRFLEQAFGAKEGYRSTRPDGKIAHTEVRIGDSVVMMGGARDEWKARPGGFYLYVPDTDAVYKRALEAGGKSLMEPANQLYGDRNAGVSDPAGNQWWIATHIEDVAPEELERRFAAAAGQH